MSFVWSAITPLVTEAQAAHMNEIQTNVDTLADSFTPPLAHYTWVNLPVAVDEEIELIYFTELKNAIDYIALNNFCSLDYAVRNTTYNGTYYVPDDAGVNAADNGGNQAVVNAPNT